MWWKKSGNGGCAPTVAEGRAAFAIGRVGQARKKTVGRREPAFSGASVEASIKVFSRAPAHRLEARWSHPTFERKLHTLFCTPAASADQGRLSAFNVPTYARRLLQRNLCWISQTLVTAATSSHSGMSL